jgi:transcriptional regulator with XRE-family HTH domain
VTDREKLCRHFGRFIRRERVWAGLTQGQLAEQAGLAQAHLSQLELGNRCPELHTAVRLLTCLGADPREALALD